MEQQNQVQYLLVLDFEANCSSDGVRDHEICEFPVVLMDMTGTILSEFRTFVKPVRIPKISAFIHGLTGITDADVATGLNWTDTMNAFEAWCVQHNLHAGNSVIVTCGDWDLKTMYVRQLSITTTRNIQPPRMKQLFSRWTNVKITYANYKKYRKLLGMDTMLKDAGIELVGRHHSGIDDCRNIAAICRYLIQKGQWNELAAGDRNHEFGHK